MANTLASILVNIDTTAGASAVNYTATQGQCPILGFYCIGVTGTGTVKITPYSATNVSLDNSIGSGGRLRITTGGAGNITGVEIAAGGSGYPNGAITATIGDVYGSGGVISCTASGGAITSASVVSAGINYSGYITFNLSDFIDGVTYEIVPRYIEQTAGSGVLRLFGYKLPYVPYISF